MTLSQDDRIQHLHQSVLKQPESKREEWLRDNCWGDEQAVSLVMSMLTGEKKSNSSLNPTSDSISLLPPNKSGEWSEAQNEDPSSINTFVERLSESSVLTPEEIDKMVADAEKNKGSATPRLLASQLVEKGKLTDFQASVLIDGQRKLLIDKYVVLDVLDAGGMGTVFKAVHRPMHRLVAIKMISQQILASQEQVRRFRREVRVAATLEHPNIVRAYDADESNGMHFLVMEYVRGQNLSRYVQEKGAMSIDRAALCILQAAKALKYAHNRGIVHRDIKPGNLMIAKGGVVKVLDLGLASIDDSVRQVENSIPDHSALDTSSFTSSNELTRSGSILGTVSFMAPEQSIDAAKADHRADIYSLGCTLYYLLTGVPPYRGAPLEVLLKHRDSEIPSLIPKRADVPAQLDAVCQRMLAKNPDDRFQSIAELVVAIDACDVINVKNRGTKPRKKTKPPSNGMDDKSVKRPIEDAPKASTIGRAFRRFVTLLVVLGLGYGGLHVWQNHPDVRAFVMKWSGHIRDDLSVIVGGLAKSDASTHLNNDTKQTPGGTTDKNSPDPGNKSTESFDEAIAGLESSQESDHIVGESTNQSDFANYESPKDNALNSKGENGPEPNENNTIQNPNNHDLELISHFGIFDFSNIKPGFLSNDWKATGGVGLDLNKGIPGLGITASGPDENHLVNESIRLGGDFFVEVQVSEATYHSVVVKLESSKTDEQFDFTVEDIRGSSWRVRFGDRFDEKTGVKSYRDHIWVRMEHRIKKDGSGEVAVLVNGQKAHKILLDRAYRCQFDKLTLDFPRSSEDGFLVKNLRWGPLTQIRKPTAPASWKSTAGIPDGWKIIGRQIKDRPFRIQSPKLQIGEEFDLDFTVDVRHLKNANFSFNLLSESGGPSVPIHFYYHGWIYISLGNSVKKLDDSNIEDHKIHVQRKDGRLLVWYGNQSNLISMDAGHLGDFQRIEFEIRPPEDQNYIKSFPVIQ